MKHPLLLTIVSVVSLLSVSGVARADAKRVGVAKLDGAQEAVVRKRVMEILAEGGYEIVKSGELQMTAESVGVELDSNDGFKAVAKALSLAAFVTGEVGKKEARLIVRNGADGALTGEAVFPGASPARIAADLEGTLLRRLGAALDRARAPGSRKAAKVAAVAEAPPEAKRAEAPPEAKRAEAPPEAKRAEAPPEAKRAAEEEETHADGDSGEDAAVAHRRAEEPAEASSSRLPFLDAAVGGRGFSRSLSYNQDLNGATLPYGLPLGPAVVAQLAFYPGAYLTGGAGAIANFGVQLDLERAVGVTSNVAASPAFPAGASFPTNVHDLSAALRFRLPLQGGLTLGALVGGGEHAFIFHSAAGASRLQLQIPDTIYRYARVGVDARLELASGFVVFGAGEYRHVLNQGGSQIQGQFFPHLGVAGIAASAGLGYRVTPVIEARLGAELRRYFYDMHSRKGDALPVGGAVDQYLSFTASLAFTLGGGGKRQGGAGQGDDDDDDDE